MVFVARSVEEIKKAIADISNKLVVGYTRVSSDLSSQDTSVTRQIEDFTDVGCNLIIVERESGRFAHNRALYQHLIELIYDGLVERVIVTSLSRLNRNITESQFFDRSCQKYGVLVNYLDEPELNGTGANAAKLKQERAFYSQMESQELSFRVKTAYVRDEKNLRFPGRIPLLGYRIENRKLVLDRLKPDLSNAIAFLGTKYYASAELGRVAVELYIKWRSQSRALKEYKKFLKTLEPLNNKKYEKELSRNLCWYGKWLKDPVTRGCLVYGKTAKIYTGEKLDKPTKVRVPRNEWRIHPNQHEALVSPSEGKEIDRLLKLNHNFGYKINNALADPLKPANLGAILRCCKCGLKFSSSGGKLRLNGSWRPRYYYCLGRQQNSKCDAKGIGEQTLTNNLIDKIIEQSEELAEILNGADTGLVVVDQTKLDLLKIKAAKAYEEYRLFGFEEDLISHRGFQQKISELEAIAVEKKTKAEEQAILIFTLSNRKFWQEMSLLDLHRYLLGIVETAWLQDGAIDRLELSF